MLEKDKKWNLKGGHAKYFNSFRTNSSHYTKDFRYSVTNIAEHQQALKERETLARSGLHHRKLRIWSHLLKKTLAKNFIFCAVLISSMLIRSKYLCKKALTTVEVSFTCNTNLHFDNTVL